MATTSRSALNGGLRFSPIERAQGRFMRAPDGHEGGGAAPASGDGAAAADGNAGNDGSPAGGVAGDGGEGAGGEAAAAVGEGDPLDKPGLLDGEPAKEGEKPAGEGEGAKEGEGEAKEGEGDKEPALTGEAPEAYELKAPEGRTLDPEALKMVEPAFRKLGLTNEGAQEMVNAAPAFIDHVAQGVRADITKSVVDTRAEWAASALADPEIGGAKFEESKAIAAKVFDRFGLQGEGNEGKPGAAFRQLLKDSGLGNHPEMIRTMVRIGRAMGEDGFERGDSAKGEVAVWDRVYGGPTPAQ